MSRPVVLSNGSLFVGLNEQGLVHDFYYPYVGLENLTNARSMQHKIGVWADGLFSWVDETDWQQEIDFSADSLVSKITLINVTLGISLHLSDFVDSEFNGLCRKIEVKNNLEVKRNIKVFMHQVFQISMAGRADTALYVPEQNYILDYKGRCSLLAYCQNPNDGTSFDQYAIGNYGIEGKEGTFKDAEDGILSGNAVEHGGVDSVVRISLEISPKSSEFIDYWVIAAASQQDAEKIHLQFKKHGLQDRLDLTNNWWHSWFSISADRLHAVDSEYLEMTKKSMMIIKAHIDKRGSILASGDSSIFNYGRDYYCYCWPRDGAYAIWPLIRLGYTEEAKNFFEFCRDVLHHDGYMQHKFQPDRAIGSTWHPLVHGQTKELAIQEDETAIIIFMLGEYYDYTKDIDYVRSLYATLIQPAANFMMDYIDDQTGLPHASYDLWEEKFATHTYTTALVQSSLRVAAKFAKLFEFPDDALRWITTADSFNKAWELFNNIDNNCLRKSILLQKDGNLLYDNTFDVSSMYSMLMYADVTEVTKKMLMENVEAVETRLLAASPVGGVPRYENDCYMRTEAEYTGNPWFVCTLWLAQYYININENDKAKALLVWSMQHALSSGVFSEQIHPQSAEPVGVAPLVWSHAEFINTVLDLSD